MSENSVLQDLLVSYTDSLNHEVAVNSRLAKENDLLRGIVEKVANKENWAYHGVDIGDGCLAMIDGPEWIGEDDIQEEAEKALKGEPVK